MMNEQITMTPEQSFFAVFCIEALADELQTTGNVVYTMLTESSDLLDSYIIPYYSALHTQSKEYIVADLLDILRKRGVVQ